MYDSDYFERGVESGASLYSNYRWIPELTIPLAHELIRILNLKEGDQVLDFGCAKGYLVKALRLLHIDAWGCDTSSYAVAQAPDDVKKFLSTRLKSRHYDAVIAKDVLEHLHDYEVADALWKFATYSDSIFVVVPLGSCGKYVIPSYELDSTHIIREPLEWWRDAMESAGFTVECKHQWGHIKENWTSIAPEGNGFLLGRIV